MMSAELIDTKSVPPSANEQHLNAESIRSKARDRKARHTSISAIFARGISVGVSFLSVPLTIGYLGLERYGLWMTISSITILVNFSDFGMGNGLLTALSEANGRNDREGARKSVAGVFYVLIAVAAVLILTVTLAYSWIPWSNIYNIKSPAAVAEAGPATVAFIVCTALCMPLGIAQRIQAGYQEGLKVNLLQSFGSLLGLALVLIMISVRTDLIYLVLAVSGSQVLAGCVNSVYEFFYSRPWLLPRPKDFTVKACQVLGKTGVQFLLLQLTAILAFNSDLLILAQRSGPAAVAEYSTAQRMFAIILVGQGVILAPLWPAYGEAFVHCDHKWIRKALIRSVIQVVALATVVSAPLILFAGPLLHLWTKQSITIPPMTLLGLAAWSVLGGYGSAIAMLLNGANQLKVQVLSASVFGVSAVLAKIYLSGLWGSAGVIWGTVLTYAICVVVPVTWHAKRLLAGARVHPKN